MNTVTLVTTVVKTTLVAYATLVTNENIVTRKPMVMLVIIATMYNSVYSNHANVGNLGEKNNNGNIIKHSSHLWMKSATKVWFGFFLVYMFIHSVTHVTLDMSITDYNLYITTQLIIYVHPHNIL